ncbi:MAG: hypothetical protein JSR86_00465 [Proteobacteria bacterium]|nr:hypothetical protein [Pseudomonadota bacterium]
MAEASFEMALDRMFAETPAFADAELFALRCEERMDRGWTTRRLLIGSLGAVGGLIGGGQLLGSGLWGRINVLSQESGHALNRGLESVLPQGFAPGGLAISAEAIWMSAALAVVAVGLALTRLVREI